MTWCGWKVVITTTFNPIPRFWRCSRNVLLLTPSELLKLHTDEGFQREVLSCLEEA